MNDITVDSLNIAEVTREQVYLTPLLGLYELNFNVDIKGPSQSEEDRSRWTVIHSARVRVASGKDKEVDLGFAWPAQPLSIKTDPGRSIIESCTFVLSLTGGQLSKLEGIRDGHDLEFKLTLQGEGGSNQPYKNAVYNVWTIRIPRSDWASKLKQAGFMDILLLEVPMLPKDLAEDWIDIRDKMEEAQGQFMNKHYRSCVSLCREIVQDIGLKKYGENWYDRAFDMIGKKSAGNGSGNKSRKEMDKEEREAAIWAALRHYTHQSHHSETEGGEPNYTRSEAKLILTLTAAFASN